MRIVLGDDGGVEFAQQRLPNCSRGFDNPWCIGVFSRDNRVGVIVYSGWQPESQVVEMSACADDPRWLSRTVLQTAFRYPFQVLDCQLVVWRVSERNERTLRLADRLGFAGTLIPRLLGREEGQFVLTLTAEDWAASRYSG
jgi:RimJ/RimL family protein N-acetyltransferase